MKFDIKLSVDADKSERISQVCKDFDMNYKNAQEHFIGEIPIENEEWSIGLIVGGSGSGKSTIAKYLFPDNYIQGFEYNCKSVLDDMPNGSSVQDIEMAFTSVGFSSPPSWLKPYNVLSTGEKMRVDLARALLSGQNLIVYDEFTSVVDRTIAKTASLAIQKAIRRSNKRFIAVSCHRDIVEWLQPDWVYDTDAKDFFGFGGNFKSPLCNWTSTELITSIKRGCGTYLGSITI
jgi:ABC-type ATPase with predicted acetyltransferase domain